MGGSSGSETPETGILEDVAPREADDRRATKRGLARLDQDRLSEMQARSERLRATMVALAAETNELPHLDRKRRRTRSVSPRRHGGHRGE
jgi:hypothetical protein